LILALEKLNVAEEVKIPARLFLSMDLSQLQNRNQFFEAFSGLSRCEQLLGPVHISYGRTLEAQRKLLASHARLAVQCQQTWFQSDVLSIYQQILSLLEQHLDPEIWSLIREKMNSCFEGDPPL